MDALKKKRRNRGGGLKDVRPVAYNKGKKHPSIGRVSHPLYRNPSLNAGPACWGSLKKKRGDSAMGKTSPLSLLVSHPSYPTRKKVRHQTLDAVAISILVLRRGMRGGEV